MVDVSNIKANDYTKGRDKYVNFAEDFLELRLSQAQKKILRAVAQNQRTLIWGGNGPGKSFIIAVLKLAFIYTNQDSIVLGTSGSYSQYYDTMWRPLDNMHRDLKSRHPVPGETKGSEKSPVLRIDKEWYAKVVSPRDPGELEGRHGADVLIVIDEADKKYVTEEHFDSGGSSITDLRDKMVAICNPPKDESNVVYRKKHSERWTTVEVSAFEAHNAMIDAGLIDDERIPGITDLITIASDWEGWNNTPWPKVEEVYPGIWPGMPTINSQIEDGELDRSEAVKYLAPGFHAARKAHENRNDLDERWYIRRAGVIPPEGSEVHRPIYTHDVREGIDRSANFEANRFAIGIDIGRTTDSTAVVGVRKVEGSDNYGLCVELDESSRRTHTDNEAICRGAIENGPLFGAVAIDAMGEGSGTADQIRKEYDDAMRFDAGTKPVGSLAKKTYKHRRAEAHAALGEFLRNGGVIRSERLENELFAAARVIQYERRRSGGHDVYTVTPKDQIKKKLGRSPDLLDAAAIAVWCFDELYDNKMRTVSAQERQSVSSTW